MRRTLLQIHLWAGLVSGLLLVILGISGSALVFRGDLERLQVREWQHVEPLAEARPLDELVAAAVAAVPGKVLSRVHLPHASTESLQVVVQKPRAQNLKDAALVSVYVDPYRASVLGTRIMDGGVFWWLQDLHYALFAGDAGLKINGVAAIVLTILAVSGPILWWPGWRRRRDAFRVRARPAAAYWRDLHAISGVVACLALLLISLTGVYFAFRSSASAVVMLATGNAANPLPPVVASAAAAPASLQALVDSARSSVPAGRLDELRPPRGGSGPYAISFRLPGDAVYGRHRLFVDPGTAQVLRIDRFDRQSAGAQVLGNMVPWHFGTFGGRLTQWVWFAVGLLPAFLFGSGLWLWLRRRRREEVRDAGLATRAPATAEAH